jgi:hypothetical protein
MKLYELFYISPVTRGQVNPKSITPSKINRMHTKQKYDKYSHKLIKHEPINIKNENGFDGSFNKPKITSLRNNIYNEESKKFLGSNLHQYEPVGAKVALNGSIKPIFINYTTSKAKM